MQKFMEASDFDGALLEKPLQDLKLCDVNIFCLRLSNVSKIKQPSYTRAGLYRPGTRLPATHDHVTTQATSKVNFEVFRKYRGDQKPDCGTRSGCKIWGYF